MKWANLDLDVESGLDIQWRVRAMDACAVLRLYNNVLVVPSAEIERFGAFLACLPNFEILEKRALLNLNILKIACATCSMHASCSDYARQPPMPVGKML